MSRMRFCYACPHPRHLHSAEQCWVKKCTCKNGWSKCNIRKEIKLKNSFNPSEKRVNWNK